MEEETDDLENIVAGLLHVEGEGVAAVPDLDEEETLKEVLDGQEGRTQHLPPRTGGSGQNHDLRFFIK